MEFHEISNLFPMMAEAEYQSLKSDIKKHGQIEPIFIYQNKIIDGRNRFKVCKELGISPIMKNWEGNDSLSSFVISRNLHRRHLTSSQKATIAIEVEKYLAIEAKERQKEAGGDRKSDKYKKSVQEFIPEPISEPQARDRAAEIMGTNPRYVSDAKKIKEQAPERFEEIRKGEKSITRVKRELKEDGTQNPIKDVTPTVELHSDPIAAETIEPKQRNVPSTTIINPVPKTERQKEQTSKKNEKPINNENNITKCKQKEDPEHDAPKQKEKIPRDQIATPAFKKSFMIFYKAIMSAKSDKWQSTTQDAVYRHLHILMNLTSSKKYKWEVSDDEYNTESN